MRSVWLSSVLGVRNPPSRVSEVHEAFWSDRSVELVFWPVVLLVVDWVSWLLNESSWHVAVLVVSGGWRVRSFDWLFGLRIDWLSICIEESWLLLVGGRIVRLVGLGVDWVGLSGFRVQRSSSLGVELVRQCRARGWIDWLASGRVKLTREDGTSVGAVRLLALNANWDWAVGVRIDWQSCISVESVRSSKACFWVERQACVGVEGSRVGLASRVGWNAGGRVDRDWLVGLVEWSACVGVELVVLADFAGRRVDWLA